MFKSSKLNPHFLKRTFVIGIKAAHNVSVRLNKDHTIKTCEGEWRYKSSPSYMSSPSDLTTGKTETLKVRQFLYRYSRINIL